jgi:diguanylate cyclase
LDPILAQLSTSLPAARTLEQLTRPLLEMLGSVSGLESTYLTTIDLEAGRQEVRYARNAGAMTIPEGLSVPWQDTLCKRALDQNVPCTDDVAGRWGDSQAARELGIQTYASAPVRTEGGELIGTLCAASPRRQALSPDAERLLQLFSRLIGGYVEREMLVERLSAANAHLAAAALTDALTGLPNRRAVLDEGHRMLARTAREGGCVLVGLVDLDGFKHINDAHGHQVGDQFLKEAARRIAAALRATDLLARLGGDEFVILGPGPADVIGLERAAASESAQAAARSLQQRCGAATVGHFQLGALGLPYDGASVGIVAADPGAGDFDHALRLADQRMYEVKRARKQARAGL